MLSLVVERASLRAWPALHEERLGGWVLRFADGYTKRANPATLLDAAELDSQRDVPLCEERFREKGLPAIFRLPSFSTPATLDALLDARGYRLVDPTLVLHRSLDRTTIGNETRLECDGATDWSMLHSRLSSRSLEQSDKHRRIVELIPSPRLFAVLRMEGKPVACGLGVLEREHFGLFDLVTDPGHRNQGHGKELVRGMLAWALNRGATSAYLQVVEDNTPARRLYESFGFEELYRYWYRVPPQCRGASADLPATN